VVVVEVVEVEVAVLEVEVEVAVVEVEVEVAVVEVEVEVVEVGVEVELEVGGAESGTCVLGAADPGQVEEPHPVKLIVARARATKKICRNLLAVVGEKRTQPP
jgi:hypothetical protein